MSESIFTRDDIKFSMERRTDQHGNHTWSASVGNVMGYGFPSAAAAYAWMKERLMQ